MKSLAEFIKEGFGSNQSVLELPRAKGDNDIFVRLDTLEKAGITANSGARSAHTDILVANKDAKKAVDVLKKKLNLIAKIL